MSGVTNASMVNSPKSKLDVLKAIKALLMRTNYIKDFVIRFYNDHEVGTSQPMLSTPLQVFPSKESTVFPA